jgi:hypothetical protein
VPKELITKVSKKLFTLPREKLVDISNGFVFRGCSQRIFVPIVRSVGTPASIGWQGYSADKAGII